jgi:hypothetical protein
VLRPITTQSYMARLNENFDWKRKVNISIKKLKQYVQRNR